MMRVAHHTSPPFRIGELTKTQRTKPHSVAMMLQRDMAADLAGKAWQILKLACVPLRPQR